MPSAKTWKRSRRSAMLHISEGAHEITGKRIILEVPAVDVAEEPIRLAVVRLADQALDHTRERDVVASGEEVEPAVVIVVPGPAREPIARAVDAQGLGDVGEVALAIVTKQPGIAVQVVDEEVRIVIVIVVDRYRSRSSRHP